MPTRRLLALIAVMVVALTGLAACDNGDDDIAVDDDVDVIEDDTTTSTEDEATTTTAEEETTTTTTADGAATAPAIDGPVNDRGTAMLEGDSLPMEMNDFYFEPTFVQTEQGARFAVELTNEGSASHTFTIEELDIDEVLEPGQSATVQVDLPDVEQMVFICRFHEAQGMRGAFFSAA